MSTLRQFIASRGLEIRMNPITGRATVDLQDLETELRRVHEERLNKIRIRKTPIDVILAEEIEENQRAMDDPPI